MIEGPTPVDQALPEIGILLGPDARGPLEAVSKAKGAELARFSIGQISYRPDRRIAVAYNVTTTAGAVLSIVLGAGELSEGAAILESNGHRIGAWVYPNDPALPGLAGLFDDERRGALLSSLGVAEVATIAITRSYRPNKRAVVEVTGPGIHLFVKAIRPRDAAALQEAHSILAPLLPIPRSLGWSSETGIVVLERLPGRPLSAHPIDAPDPRAILSLLERIPRLERDSTSRRRRLEAHLNLLRRILPDQIAQLERIEGAATGIMDADPTPVHGDLHSGQLLVSGGRLTGLVDIDTVGIGQRSDDLANLVAHLHMLALSDTTGETARYGEKVFAMACANADAADLRLRIATTLLGYAPSPWSRQETNWATLVARRIGAAVEWLPPS